MSLTKDYAYINGCKKTGVGKEMAGQHVTWSIKSNPGCLVVLELFCILTEQRRHCTQPNEPDYARTHTGMHTHTDITGKI